MVALAHEMAPHGRPCEKRRVPDATVAPAAADALLSLPTEVLDEIVGRLHLCDAVRTSALSRAWRRRWESLPALSLSFLDRPDTPHEVVDSVLIRYAGRIPRFSFRLYGLCVDRLDDWLLALSRRGIESIRLETTFKFRLHSCIFSCAHLVFLEVHDCRISPLPEGFAGFPVLKELKLVRVLLPANGGSQLEVIIGGSPLLGVLTLGCVEIPGQEVCVIVSPNLHSLQIFSGVDVDYNWEIGELPSLEDVDIDLESYAYASDFGEFLARVAQVRKLTINTCYPPYLGGNLLDTLEYTFVNLRSLFLYTHFCETHAILSTLCLLRSAPNLEELEIEIEGNENQQQEIEANNAEFQNTKGTNGLCANLQVVKMNGIDCLSNEMCFIEFVLSKARVLRTMSITLSDRSSKSTENALIELNTYQRASSHAQVFFKGSDSS